ncbi:BrnA antitoxin family protein [Sphingomonas sp.]|uniref:BrnA antitoxin family protein n=1 Tax=Sphingomonas sp. TaxID=28214 RepID=UPI000DB0B433|nr:BrnA antitoxin family protein [Sphingomonas sp.]PZU10047.1 MAG: hypothetical protein DI605_05450 [Sphingomonas sp.]
MSKGPPPEGFDENPEWTDETTARARPASEVLPPHAMAALVRRKPGRPAGSTTSAKTQVALRVDNDVIERFRAGGAGWQSRMNEALRKAVGL